MQRLSYCCATLSLSIAILAGLELQYLGFPDGHITDLDGAKRVLYTFAATVSLLFSAWFVYSGIQLKTAKEPKTLFISVTAFVIILGTLALLYHYYSSVLDGGQGG